MNENDFRARVAAGQRPPPATGCPDPDRLLALAEGTLAQADRLPLLDHLSQCAACRRELEMLRMVGVQPAQRGTSRLGWWRPVAIAAVATLAVGLGVRQWMRVGMPDDTVLRGPESTAPGVVPDTLALPLLIHWNALPEAVTYDVELLETDGVPRFTASVADTLVAVPDSSTTAGRTYDLTVSARRIDGRDSLLTNRRIHLVRPP
jgi:hypothetical protein